MHSASFRRWWPRGGSAAACRGHRRICSKSYAKAQLWRSLEFPDTGLIARARFGVRLLLAACRPSSATWRHSAFPDRAAAALVAAFGARGVHAVARSFSDEAAFELRDCAEDMEHQLASRRRGVDLFFEGKSATRVS